MKHKVRAGHRTIRHVHADCTGCTWDRYYGNDRAIASAARNHTATTGHMTWVTREAAVAYRAIDS